MVRAEGVFPVGRRIFLALDQPLGNEVESLAEAVIRAASRTADRQADSERGAQERGPRAVCRGSSERP